MGREWRRRGRGGDEMSSGEEGVEEKGKDREGQCTRPLHTITSTLSV